MFIFVDMCSVCTSTGPIGFNRMNGGNKVGKWGIWTCGVRVRGPVHLTALGPIHP